jgi:hypothetical protein
LFQHGNQFEGIAIHEIAIKVGALVPRMAIRYLVWRILRDTNNSATMAEEIHIHDVLIIGAGPCGLALAARLCESTPSALFTDSEHQKFHFLRRAQDPSGYNLKKNRKPIRTSRRAHTSLDRLLAGPSIPKSSGIDIAVLDKSGNEWMTVWNRLFGALKIEHLRSPMFFHADPGDRDALRGFVWREGRERELREIEGVVGRELSKWQRKKKQKGRHG